MSRSSVTRVEPARFFETVARRYDRAYAPPREVTRARMRRVLELLEGPHHSARPRRVLDLGVGTGRELGMLQDAGHEIVGVDASPSMIALCKRRARPIPIVEADLFGPLPFPDAAFDAVLALHGTLAHPPDEAALASLAREVARVLVRTRDAVLIAEVPSPTWLASLPTAPPDDDRELAVFRSGEDRFVHEDRALGLSIEGCAFDAARWQRLFAESLVVEVEPLGEAELRVIARPRVE